MDSAPLLETMTQEISRQQKGLLAEARARAELILAEAEVSAKQRREETIASLKEELDALAETHRERAEANAKSAMMSIKDTITDDILKDVRAELIRIAEDDTRFQPILIKLLDELLISKVGTNWRNEGRLELKVKVPGAHVDAINRWLRDQGVSDVQVETLHKLIDGVALQDAEQSFRISNTLHDRLEKQEKKLRGFAMKQLFGELSGDIETGDTTS